MTTLKTIEHDGPIVVAFGGGVNSVAMLVGFVTSRQHIDLITFSDTKGEKPETYDVVKRMSSWGVCRGLPPITVVRTVSPVQGYEGLEGMCNRLETLPSKAFGYKSCSQRFKIEPQQKYLNHWQPSQTAWQSHRKVMQLIGYDAGEPHRAKVYTNDKYEYWYPLIDWGWGRDECVTAIRGAGLPIPPKSACFFCPSMRKAEVIQIARTHPDLYRRAIEMEDRALASGKCETVKGLGRHWSWRELVAADQSAREKLADPPAVDCACYDGESEEGEEEG